MTDEPLIEGIINPQGEKATLPESYFKYQTSAGVPIAYKDTATIPRAPTGSGYYWGMKKDVWGFYSNTSSQAGDPWSEWEKQYGGTEPAIVSELKAIEQSGQQQFAAQEAQIHEAGKAEFGGTFSDYGLRMATAPVGTQIPTPTQYEQVKALGTGKQTFTSPEEFQKMASEYGKFAPFAGVTEFKGIIVPPLPVYEPTGMIDYGESPFGRGLIKPENFPGKKTYPSTPIDYERTDISELTTYPLYKGAAGISKTLTSGFEYGVDIIPAPTPVKEGIKGFGSVFTGLPEYFASGALGFELAAREPELFKKSIVPAFKEFGGQVAEQAVQRPFYTAGQAVGLVAMWKGVPSSKASVKLLEGTKLEPLKLPEKPLLPRAPKGMEGLEVLKLPESPGKSRPIVIEGVKDIKTAPSPSTVKTSSAIPEMYQAALEKGAAPFAERGVMGIRFGSKGYRPTGTPKPENIFTGKSLSQFIREEKAVSYIPTFERLKAIPQAVPKLKVITAEKTFVLPSLRTLEVVKTTPKTALRILTVPKTTTKTAVTTDILTQTRPKITVKTNLLTRTMISTKTKTFPRTRFRTDLMTSTMPLTETAIMPTTMTRLAVATAPAVKNLVKEMTQTQARTQIKTKMTTDILTVKKTKPKTKKIDISGFRKLKGKKRHGKFPEISPVASPRQLLKGLKRIRI